MSNKSEFERAWAERYEQDVQAMLEQQSRAAFYALATIGLCIAYGIACEMFCDAVPYAGDYFRDKHGYDEALVALGLPVPPRARCAVCNGTGGVTTFMNGRDNWHPCPRGCP